MLLRAKLHPTQSVVSVIVRSYCHFIYITYREVALQPQLIFKGPLILQEIELISKILTSYFMHICMPHPFIDYK